MATAASQYSRALQLKLSDAGLQGALQADAFKTLLQYISEVQGDLDVLYSILEQLKQNVEESGTVTKASVESAIRQLAGTTSTETEHIVIVDAFKVPRVRFDSIHRRLVEDNGRPATLQPNGDEKIRLYQNRFNLLHQRLRRNSRFAPLNAVQAVLPNQMHAELAELTGLKGSVGKRCIVMGLISTQEDGGLALEDEGAIVPVDLTHAAVHAGIVTENCIVIAEGEMGHDGVFRVVALGFPQCETRSELPATAQKLNFFGAPMLSTEQQAQFELAEMEALDARIVFLANVWLDRAGTFDSLHTLFSGFQDADMIPAMIVIMGNFSARATSNSPDADYVGLKEGFRKLARLIDTYSRIKESCRFVFVPGPNDPGLGQVLPQPRLPTYFTSELQTVLPNAVFATNPCRIRYYSREIIVFRYDLMKQMCRRSLVPIAEDVADDPNLMFQQLAKTVLQQSCLCPLPLQVQPVHWAHDSALQVYPLPHAVVLADASPPASFAHEGCTVFNPGCLQERNFAAYKPCEDEVEPSELPSATQGSQDDL